MQQPNKESGVDNVSKKEENRGRSECYSTLELPAIFPRKRLKRLKVDEGRGMLMDET